MQGFSQLSVIYKPCRNWPRPNVHCDTNVLGLQDIEHGARSQPPRGEIVQKTHKQAVM